MIRHLSRPNGVNHKNESGRSTPRSSSPAVEIELAPPSRLHPVTAIGRRSPSMSVTCTYVQKVQHKSPGHLACKALRGVSPSALTSAALYDFVVPRYLKSWCDDSLDHQENVPLDAEREVLLAKIAKQNHNSYSGDMVCHGAVALDFVKVGAANALMTDRYRVPAGTRWRVCCGETRWPQCGSTPDFRLTHRSGRPCDSDRR